MDPATPIIYNNLKTSQSKRKSSSSCCWLVPMIILANFVTFIIVMFINNCPHNHTNCVAPFLGRFSFQPSSENPFLGPSFSTLFKMGALQWDKVVNQHQGWRLITCIWLHAGILHLLLNMFSLAIIALYGCLEQQFGFVRIGILYLVSGLGGSVLSSLFLGQAITFGASGALFGLLGAMLSEVISNWTIYANKAAALIPILIMIALNFVVGMLPHFNHFAPVGGFLSGFLLGFVLLLRPRYGWIKVYRLPEDERPQSKYYMTYQIVLLFIAAVALITGFTVALVMLFQGKNGYDHCKWCRYLNY